MTTFLALLLSASLAPPADQSALTGQAATLFAKARATKFYATAAKLDPDVLPTSDGKSFYTVWRSAGPSSAPKNWIVSLPGTAGFATDDLAIWSPHLKGRDVGLVSLQWWLGKDNSPASYYTPVEAYREIDRALATLGVQPSTVMFHGFSRGSSNAYSIVAIDAGMGKKYFSLNVASSGGVSHDYAPTMAITKGTYGARPLAGTRWITVAGGKDSARDGIPGMRLTAEWLETQGGTVIDSIEDWAYGHGALLLNGTNARKVLDLFLSKR